MTNLQNRQILNIFNLSLFLILVFSLVQGPSYSAVEVVIEPNKPKQGDTLAVKVKKTSENNNPPKVYFGADKLPVFEINNGWYRALVPITASQESKEYEFNIVYEGEKKTIPITINETPYKVESITLSKEVSGLVATKIEKESVRKAVNTVSSQKYWNGKFIFPSEAHQSTEYGVKRKINGVQNPDYFHKGLDFASPEGGNVKAPENGKIILAGLTSKGFVVNGNCIFLDHGHGVISAYLHLSKVLVKEGDVVKKGQLIGKVGSTGIATGPHLHWGVYVLGKPVEPLVWINTSID